MAATGHPRCPTLALLSAAPLLHGVEKLLLGVDTELGKDCLAVGVGGVARDAQLLADEADVAPARQQRYANEHCGLGEVRPDGFAQTCRRLHVDGAEAAEDSQVLAGKDEPQRMERACLAHVDIPQGQQPQRRVRQEYPR